MSNSKFKNDNDKRHQYKKQILFISKRFEIHVVKFDKFIYERIFVVNKTNDNCKTYRETFNQNFIFVNKINLRDCQKKSIFYITKIDFEYSSMFFCSLIFSKKFMNFQRQIILNLIA